MNMRHIILFLVALTAFSCAKEPDVTPEAPEQKGTPITVTAHNAGYDTSSPSSRAEFEGDNFGALTWNGTEQLGVYYHQATGDNWGIFKYDSATESGGAIFVTPEGFVWNESVETHDFRAYYPYNETYHTIHQSNNSEAVTFTLPVNQDEFSYAESQLCIAETTGVALNGQVHFQFEPVLAYLQLKLYTTDLPAEGEKIYLSQLKMYTEDQDGPIAGNYTVNMGTRAIIDGSSHTINFQLGSSTSSGLDITGYTSKENAYKFYAVMLPVDLSNRPLRFRGLVTHEKDNGDGTKSYTSYSMVARAKAGTAFKSGKGYAMTIEVQSNDSMEFPADADFAVRLGDRWVDFKDIYTEDAEGITITMSPEDLMSMGSDLYFAANATKDVQFDRDGGQLAVISALVKSMYAAQGGTDPIDVDLSNISFDGEFGLGGIFEGNTALGSIILPSGMTKINNPGFTGCTNLTPVTLPETLETIGGKAFKGCSSLKSIIIPNSVTTISDSAFDSCTALTYVKLPDGIKTLDASTFRDCTALPTVTVPASVATIDKTCFQNCTALAEITLLNPDAVVEISGDTLENVGTSVAEGTTKKLRVPAALAEQYRSDSNWSELLNAGFVLETF